MPAKDEKKQELTDKELSKAAGGANIDGGGGNAVVDPSVIEPTSGAGWTDEEGVFHAGTMPGSVQPTSSLEPPLIMLDEEGNMKPQ